MMECESSEASPWAWIATSRLRPSDDPFFDEGNAACHLSHKHFKTSAETDEEDDRSAMIACQIGQCAKTFHDICSYESHYHSAHSNRCASCSKVLPTSRLLEIHVLENHDSMFPLLAEKQNMFQCLVATCSHLFPNPENRKEHLIKVHRYPASFRFERSRKKRGKENKSLMEVDAFVEGPEPMEVTRKFSYKVPKEICFGKGHAKTFHQKKPKRKHWHQKEQTTKSKVNIEEVQMKDLADALEK